MRINSIKIGKKPEVVIHDKSLIDYVVEEFKDKPHMIFKAAANKCSSSNLVDINDKETFLSNDGEFTIVETPGDPVTAIYAVIAVIAIAAAAYVYLTLPDIVSNQGQGSNNRISARTNQERPLQRIEDIAGSVRSYPSLIQQTYKKFDDVTRLESEYSLMCVSKGEGDISNVKDSETPIQAIKNAGAMFYRPNKMPSLDEPFLTVGSSFNEKVEIITRSNEVAGGQVLDWGKSAVLEIPSGEAINQIAVGTDVGIIDIDSESTATFDRFNVGDTLELLYPQDFSAFRFLVGVYEVVSVSSKQITLDKIGGGGVLAVSSNWDQSYTNDGEASLSPTDLEDKISVGPFFLSIDDRTKFFANFAAAGLQKDNGDEITVEFGLEYAQADKDGNRIGDWSGLVSSELIGSDKDKIGKTIEVVTPFVGPCLVKFRRVTEEIKEAALQDITLDALYSVSPINVDHFGDVTTVQTRTVTNSSASQLKQRKFNLIFKRKLDTILEDGSIGPFKATDRFIDYFLYASLNEKIGRRKIEEINTKELYEKYKELTSYFGTDEAGLFNYTFDSDQVSFQETLQTICDAVFCRTFRRGGIITIKVDKPGIPKTIFTHRNKIPDQQTITRTFKSSKIKDGVEFLYVNPADGDVVTLQIPTDGSALTPEKIQSKGVKNHNQAWWLAWRRYNQITNQKVSIKDTFTSEGSLLSVGDIIAVSNNTKIKPQSGEVVGVSGLLLTLSEPVYFDDNDTHSIALRARNGTIEVIQCGKGINSNQVVLSKAPNEAPYTAYNEEKTVFIFNKDDRLNSESYVISHVDRTNTHEIPVEGFNYTDAYYEKDGEQSPRN